jgi:hypothetical protein
MFGSPGTPGARWRGTGERHVDMLPSLEKAGVEVRSAIL